MPRCYAQSPKSGRLSRLLSSLRARSAARLRSRSCGGSLLLPLPHHPSSIHHQSFIHHPSNIQHPSFIHPTFTIHHSSIIHVVHRASCIHLSSILLPDPSCFHHPSNIHPSSTKHPSFIHPLPSPDAQSLSWSPPHLSLYRSYYIDGSPPVRACSHRCPSSCCAATPTKTTSAAASAASPAAAIAAYPGCPPPWCCKPGPGPGPGLPSHDKIILVMTKIDNIDHPVM